VSILTGKGNRTFDVRNYPVGDQPSAVTVGTFDDNICCSSVRTPDLAVSNFGSDSVSVLLNDGAGQFEPAVSYPVGDGPTDVLAWFFHRGQPFAFDIVTSNFNSDNVSVLIGRVDGTFEPARHFLAGDGPRALNFDDDPEGDGAFDLVVANGLSDNVSLLRNALPCAGLQPTITGNGAITGTPGDDVIRGGAQNDTIDGGGGNDVICGSEGADLIRGGSGNDRIQGDDGNDRLFGDDGDDRVFGGEGNDQLEGAGGADRLFGENGADSLTGGDGADGLSGAAGDDQLVGNAGADSLTGAAGNDRLFGGADPDDLVGGLGTDTCDGGGGTDTGSCETLTGVP
jgi:Ca2+-binding RTX toxin-like protein